VAFGEAGFGLFADECAVVILPALRGSGGAIGSAAVMILTAQSPASGAPSTPFSFLEEVKQVMSQHKAVRVNVVPEDDVVTVEEANRFLDVPEGFVEDAVALGVIKQANSSDGPPRVKLDSLLEFERSCAASPRNSLDEFFDELKAEGLY